MARRQILNDQNRPTGVFFPADELRDKVATDQVVIANLSMQKLTG